MNAITPIADNGLLRYETAVRALAEAKAVDEVKDIRDKAEAMRAYARQANNKQLEVDAAEIRMRAERRLGELMEAQRAAGLLSPGNPNFTNGSQADPLSKPPTLAEAGIDKHLADRARKMAAVPADKFDSMIGDWRERVQAENERVTTDLLREGQNAITRKTMSSSSSPEWYTPKHVVDLAVQVLGTIDLDPCWHPDSPVDPVEAYTEKDNGLQGHWDGRVYLNPPYGREIDLWVGKLVQEYQAGHVQEAVALVPARVDTEWFRLLDDYPRCFIHGRLTFSNADNPAPFPSAVFYLGNDVAKFHRIFGGIGGVFVRLEADAA